MLKYAKYLTQTHNPKLPASWAERQTPGFGEKKGRENDHTNGHTNGYANGHIDGEKASIPLTQAYLDDKYVRTDYGLIPLSQALDWPVFASYDELLGCASWMGGRIPTADEARSIYSHVDGLRVKEAEQHLGKTVPAVNGCVIH
jgi:hypothetical protein